MNCATFSIDSLNAASGSEGNTVKTWNLRTLKQEFIFEGHTDSIQSIKFTDNKNLLASGAGNKKIIICD